LIRRKINESTLGEILEALGVNIPADKFEVLGEKLCQRICRYFTLIRTPIATNKYILAEVKTGKIQKKELNQINGYASEFDGDSAGAMMIAKEFPKTIPQESRVLFIKYSFGQIDRSAEYTYEEAFKEN